MTMDITTAASQHVLGEDRCCKSLAHHQCHRACLHIGQERENPLIRPPPQVRFPVTGGAVADGVGIWRSGLRWDKLIGSAARSIV